MIELENISKQYERKIILDNLNLKFDKGLIYHLSGANGVGKTTFLNILYNIATPTSGRYLFKKTLIPSRNQNIKDTIGFFHTNAKYLINDFTVEEYIDCYDIIG